MLRSGGFALYPVPRVPVLRFLSHSWDGANERPGIQIAGLGVFPFLPGASQSTCLRILGLTCRGATGLDVQEFWVRVPVLPFTNYFGAAI